VCLSIQSSVLLTAAVGEQAAFRVLCDIDPSGQRAYVYNVVASASQIFNAYVNLLASPMMRSPQING
jgi:hypothetical protein